MALANDLNANLVHKWRRGRGARPAALPRAVGKAPPAQFIALSLAGPTPPAAAPLLPPPPAADIRVHLKRGATAVVVSWPSSAAAHCAAWLRELLR